MCITYTSSQYGDEFFVECVHHFFKQTHPGVKYDHKQDKVFAIVGLRAHYHKVVEFHPSLARITSIGDLAMDTSLMRDFMKFGVGTICFDEMKIEEGFG